MAEAIEICNKLVAMSNVCTLECTNCPYLDAKSAENRFEIKVELFFAGIDPSFVDHYGIKQNFTFGIAATIDNTEPLDIINIVASNSPNSCRKLAVGDKMAVTFDIEVNSPNEMMAAQNTILDISENTDEGGPNLFAQEMEKSGIISSPKQLTLKQ